VAKRGVVVLGAGGFIGRALVARLAASGERAIAVVRTDMKFGAGVEVRVAGTLTAATDWPALLAGADAVVHLASRAHAPPETGEGWIDAEASTAASLGSAARLGGIERLVFMSSVKVHGAASGARPFRASDRPAPADPYGRAKARVEGALRPAGVPLVILRPPLVYGPGVGANFRSLVALVARGVPLPLASVANARSLIYLDNLLDGVELALSRPEAPGHAFLMRDARDVATPELIRLIARGLGRRARLLPCPPSLLRLLARMAGRGDDAERLLDSLIVDDAPTRFLLGWRPAIDIADGIAATCRWFQEGVRSGLIGDGAGKSASVRPSRR
jgi:nucleoside-diphosphate-sugar epimerase